MGKKKTTPAVKKAPAAVAVNADKAGKRKTMQQRAGLEISPPRCKRIIALSWRGGKISTEASVVLAALLQYLTKALLSGADALVAPGVDRIQCGHLNKALDSMAWLRTSGVIRGQVVGAARGE
jgi:hypothetical protein